ncbi:ATP-binding cassette sub-family G member 4 [Melipona quadrifasciata]|uniref:ATP-binding cassette sub-family G member 4 n=1 Tax=Melipona quadrifasciata TaxID=166423 RepID=A0A0N0BJH4_9HYME|nr:ATP-binding cassette sub-family G member 4 [Melipona quadrifasciata]
MYQRVVLLSLPRVESIDIQFTDLSCEVRDGFRGPLKKILNNVSGTFKTGELSAIIGLSGAGKSTLLNILTGFRRDKWTGKVEYIGDRRKHSWKEYRKQSCYIQQNDCLLPLFTVSETMWMAANLKIGESLNRKSKEMLIVEMLENLDLSKTMETKCGRLSGGQKKRLSIALELLDNPPVMFLDEPTTGLDSLSSYQCVKLLRGLAKAGRTIICTIHQPSAAIYEMFDTAYLLAGGRCMYEGATANTIAYFASVGLHCPKYHNPADYMIEVVSKEYGDFNDQLVKLTSNKEKSWRLDTSRCLANNNSKFDESKVGVLILMAFAHISVSYFLSGQPAEVSRYCMFLLVAILTTLVSESMGLFIGVLTNPTNGTFLGAIILCGMMGLSGCLALFKHMPRVMYYSSYVSYVRHSLDGFFQALYGYNREKTSCSENYCHYNMPKTLLTELSMTDGNYWMDILYLFCYYAFFRIAVYFSLKRKLSKASEKKKKEEEEEEEEKRRTERDGAETRALTTTTRVSIVLNLNKLKYMATGRAHYSEAWIIRRRDFNLQDYSGLGPLKLVVQSFSQNYVNLNYQSSVPPTNEEASRRKVAENAREDEDEGELCAPLGDQMRHTHSTKLFQRLVDVSDAYPEKASLDYNTPQTHSKLVHNDALNNSFANKMNVQMLHQGTKEVLTSAWSRRKPMASSSLCCSGAGFTHNTNATTKPKKKKREQPSQHNVHNKQRGKMKESRRRRRRELIITIKEKRRRNCRKSEALMHTMWMVPRLGSAVKWGETGAVPGAQPGAEPVKGGGELTGVDGCGESTTRNYHKHLNLKANNCTYNDHGINVGDEKGTGQLTDIVGICVEGCSFGGGVSRRVLAEFIRAILKQKERTRNSAKLDKFDATKSPASSILTKYKWSQLCQCPTVRSNPIFDKNLDLQIQALPQCVCSANRQFTFYKKSPKVFHQRGDKIIGTKNAGSIKLEKN